VFFAAMLVGAALAAPGFENVQADFASQAPRFRERRLVQPIVAAPPAASNVVPLTNLPEPAAAAAPRKSLVEEATGLKMNDDFQKLRFAQVTSQVEAPAAATFVGAGGDTDDKIKALKGALQNVKDQIVAKAQQIKSEKHWVGEVTKIITSYVTKTRRVNANIRKLQAEVKDLFRKKKQIDNLIMQRKLEDKLKVANKDLQTLQGALHNVKKKQDAFQKSKRDIATTIGAIELELRKLKGKGKKAPKGGKKAGKKGKKGKKGGKGKKKF